jgi:enolase
MRRDKMTRTEILDISALEILSSSGRPTVQCTVCTAEGRSTASVPIGASRGKYEAIYLYDGGDRYAGYGVRKAVENINTVIAKELKNTSCLKQKETDRRLIRLDGTEDKSRLGANAILAVSLAVARAGAKASGLPLYQYIGGLRSTALPAPIATVLGGGKYSPSQLDFEDYLYVLNGFETFPEALEALVATYYTLGELLVKKLGGTSLIGGGAFGPAMNDSREAFEIMVAAVEKAGFSGKISLGIDAVGSDLYHPEGFYQVGSKKMDAGELAEYYMALTRQFPLVLIEDPFHEDDYAHFARLTAALPGIQIVGDDLFATNPARLKRGMGKEPAANAVLIKANQIGTLTEVCDVARIAAEGGLSRIVSARSSDTNDSFIADLAVGLNASHIKIGSPATGEKNAKYNRLLEIAREIETL